MKPLYTAIDINGQAMAPGDHKAVRVDHPLLAQPMIWTAHRSKERLTWKKAKAWAESLDINGWSWRLPTVEEAFLLCDRTRAESPAVPVEFFPDCEGEWIWTGTEDAQPPAGYAWDVNLNHGNSNRFTQYYGNHVRAVRAGQF
jgi:hypothetical protein